MYVEILSLSLSLSLSLPLSPSLSLQRVFKLSLTEDERVQKIFFLKIPGEREREKSVPHAHDETFLSIYTLNESITVKEIL